VLKGEKIQKKRVNTEPLYHQKKKRDKRSGKRWGKSFLLVPPGKRRPGKSRGLAHQNFGKGKGQQRERSRKKGSEGIDSGEKFIGTNHPAVKEKGWKEKHRQIRLDKGGERPQMLDAKRGGYNRIWAES